MGIYVFVEAKVNAILDHVQIKNLASPFPRGLLPSPLQKS